MIISKIDSEHLDHCCYAVQHITHHRRFNVPNLRAKGIHIIYIYHSGIRVWGAHNDILFVNLHSLCPTFRVFMIVFHTGFSDHFIGINRAARAVLIRNGLHFLLLHLR